MALLGSIHPRDNSIDWNNMNSVLLQVASGTGYPGSSEVAGIAYAAHIGGFFAGMLLVKKFIPERRL